MYYMQTSTRYIRLMSVPLHLLSQLVCVLVHPT